METYEIYGKKYPVKGHVRIIDDQDMPTGETIPIVDIPMMSDYQWQLDALNSRLKTPELYRPYEDVDAVIARLRKWLKEHESEGAEA